METVDGAPVGKQQNLKEEEDISEESVLRETCKLALAALDLQIARGRLALKKKLQTRDELATLIWGRAMHFSWAKPAEEESPQEQKKEEKPIHNSQASYRPCGFCNKDVKIQPTEESDDPFHFFYIRTDETVFCSYQCVEKWCERALETFTGDDKP